MEHLTDEIGFEKTQEVLDILRRTVIPIEDAILHYRTEHERQKAGRVIDDVCKLIKKLEKEL